MPDLLALSYHRQGWTAVEAHIGSGHLKILGTASEPWQDPARVNDNPAEAGRQLQAALLRAGIKARTAWLIVPREEVILRHLELPPVSDAELPDMVRFQTSARSSVAIEQLLLDFIPLAVKSASEQRNVLAATINDSTVQPIRRVVEEAGLEIAGMTISSVAIAELLTHTAVAHNFTVGDSMLGLIADNQRMEVVIVHERQLLYAHAARLPAGDPQAQLNTILAESSRALVATERLAPNLKLQHAWLVAPEFAESHAAISERLGCPVEPLNPVTDTASKAPRSYADNELMPIAGPVGLLLGRQSALVPGLDFLHPRKAPPQRDPRKVMLAAASAAALLIVATLISAFGLWKAGIESATFELAKKSEQNRGKLKSDEPMIAAANEIRDWVQHGPDQLALMSSLYAQMDGTSRVYLSRYTSAPGGRDALVKVTGEGRSKDRATTQELNATIDREPGRRVRFKTSTPNSVDAEYPEKFELDFDVIVEAAKPVPATPTTNAAKGTATTAAATPPAPVKKP